MKSMIVLSLIIAFMFIGYLVNGWLQQVIHPRQSFGSLSLYFLVMLVFIFILSFLMVLVIGRLYPNELMK